MIDEIATTAKLTSDSLKQHGLALTLAVSLTAILCFFTWSLWQATQTSAIENQRIQQEQIKELNARLDGERDRFESEREFARNTLVKTVDRNSEALEQLVDELRSP